MFSSKPYLPRKYGRGCQSSKSPLFSKRNHLQEKLDHQYFKQNYDSIKNLHSSLFLHFDAYLQHLTGDYDKLDYNYKKKKKIIHPKKKNKYPIIV